MSLILFGCNPSQSFYLKELERVKVCRENWRIDTLLSKTEIKLLLHSPKGRYHLGSWPNFFIGIDNKGDTIGIISYETDSMFKKGTMLNFVGARIRNTLDDKLSSLSSLPVDRISKRARENNLYCSVKRIFYGELTTNPR